MRLLFSEIVNALCWYLDFKMSARFGSWLTPVGFDISAKVVNALCWYVDFKISARFGSWLMAVGPGVSPRRLLVLIFFNALYS